MDAAGVCSLNPPRISIVPRSGTPYSTMERERVIVKDERLLYSDTVDTFQCFFMIKTVFFQRHIPIQARVPVIMMKEGKRFVAYTPALDLSTSGRTFEQAKKRFEEAVQIFIEETTQRGTIERVLENYGWTRIRQQWAPPVVVAQESTPVQLRAAA